MKKNIYIIVIMFCLVGFGYLLGTKSDGIPDALLWEPDVSECLLMDFGCKDATNTETNIENKGVVFGAYDPDGILSANSKITVDHYYFSWLTFDEGDFRLKVESSKEKNRSVFVTLEPWAEDEANSQNLLTDISSGKYDKRIEKVCVAIENVPEKIDLSFAHEMDHDLTTRYPWSGKDKDEFIKSYKYFIDKCRSLTDNAIYVWSPVGDKKALDYWPGDAYVDIVGFPIYSLEEFDIFYHGYARSFVESAKEKYDRLFHLNKPMIIVELGVSGTGNRKSLWIKEMMENLHYFTRINEVLFFNAEDHEGVWGEDLPTPDWRIDNSLI